MFDFGQNPFKNKEDWSTGVEAGAWLMTPSITIPLAYIKFITPSEKGEGTVLHTVQGDIVNLKDTMEELQDGISDDLA